MSYLLSTKQLFSTTQKNKKNIYKFRKKLKFN